jgi:hypothetical protein
MTIQYRIYLLLSWLLLAACWVDTSSCDPSNQVLTGAYGDLPFDRILAYRDHADLFIVYEKKGGGDGMVPTQVARLMIHTDRLEIKEDEECVFVSPEMATPAGTIERYLTHQNAFGEAVQEPPLPEILNASITFKEYGTEVGDAIQGNFQCVFIDKKHLNGNFEVTLGNL